MSGGPRPGAQRARAARLVHAVTRDGKTIDQMFGRHIEDDPLVRELALGTLRYYHCLTPLVSARLTQALRRKDRIIFDLMLVGAYQLLFMRTPDHAAVAETVAACPLLKRPWARGLTNAVLRRIQAAKGEAKNITERSFCLPDWIRERFQADYPSYWRSLAAASLERAPMSLRINALRCDPHHYLSQLRAAGLAAHRGFHPEHLVLTEPVPVKRLPGYGEGLVSVQDAGAQFAARLVCANTARGTILDACAAPGGKLFHMAELAPNARIFGLEQSEARHRHLVSEAKRLGHERVRLLLGDATSDHWQRGEDDVPACFDAILLDAPCSGSGTLRRHPDMKILRKPGDLAAHTSLQGKLLSNLWRFLAPGGTFIYCTCSLFAEENDRVLDTFLASTADAEVLPFQLPVGIATRHGWQLLPLPAEADPPDLSVDGFFYARLTRRTGMSRPGKEQQTRL